MQETIAFQINALHKSFIAHTSRILKEKGLNHGQLPFILYIGKHPECAPSELKNDLKIDWGYSQRAITKLVEHKFITKSQNTDSDKYQLELTEKGLDAFQACKDAFAQWDEENLYMLSEEEALNLKNMLQKILTHIS